MTGFEAFGRVQANPTQDLVRHFDGYQAADHRITARILPVRLTGTADRVRDLLAEVKPDLVLAFGVAESAQRLRLERQAHNEARFTIPDNDGARPEAEALDPAAPAARAASLALAPLSDALARAGIEHEYSDDPGRYLCNAVYFHLLAAPTPAAFIHVPPAPDSLIDGPAPHAWPQARLIAAARVIIDAALSARARG